MRGRAAVDGVMYVVAAALLLFPPVSGRIGWAGWGLAVAAGAGLGVVAAAVGRPPTGARGWLVLLLAVGPMLALAAVSAAAGFCYVAAHAVGVVAGRARFPA